MILRRIFSSLVVILIAVGLVIVPIGQVTPVVSAHTYGTTVVYNLFATDTFIRTANGEIIYNYGFVGGRAGLQNVQFQQSVGEGGTNFANTTLAGGWPTPAPGDVTPDELALLGNAQFPAPLIYAKVGDVVQINLKNLGGSHPGAPNDPHSIHLHGLDVNAANDGVPETSVGAIPANSDDPGAGNVVVYMFPATTAGTYMYHCHQEANIHVNMGMYGALVIYNNTDPAAAGGPNTTGGGKLYGFAYDRDYVLLLSEVDKEGHLSEQNPEHPEVADFNWAHYQPEYWFINGLNFPQTVHSGFPETYKWEDWLAAHPGYDPLISGSAAKPATHYWGTRGEKILLRMINMGFEAQPMHMHGYHGKVIGSDERGWNFGNTPRNGYAPPTAFGKGLEKQTLLIGSGETYDWLIDLGQQKATSTYASGTQSRFDPSTNDPKANTETTFDAIPDYVGGPAVPQIFPFHNHDDYKATNNGAYPGGMFTMIIVK